MSRSVNNVTLLGNLTAAPVLRTTKSGKSVADFRIATNQVYTDDKGQRHEQADFHQIVAWGNLADTASKYLVKGSRVYVEGSLQNKEWVASDGQRQFRTEVVIDRMIMLDNKAIIDAVNEKENTNGTANHDTQPDTTFSEAETN